ncbi:acyl-CoA dehydrogenase family protein [Streptomyces sp. AM 4-1-1]|uniref:acyl-CoA dehydrogenase family protein n=1 Tax=unclassified Streptomyces TaxID=2593676 RepID=UPI0023B8F2A6|nr:acyl-CoA dehydrogenase family protein [Streptomyces sp. AM 4-1-1]WEH32436.1 acyl-CoA dehydrogenase family protein [Streptomyces sp. AM 4-1-1]
MTLLDERLRTLQHTARGWAEQIRPLVLPLEADPEAVREHLDLPLFSYLARTPVPREYQPDPIVVDGHAYYGTGGLERVVFCEEIASVDAGMLLAAPGPSLSGVLVALLGDEEQRSWFYGRLMARPTWTFLALTEPDRGSDAGSLTTLLTPGAEGGPLLLNGAKRFIGNAARSDLGVVFARTRPGPLGVVAALVETARPGFEAVPFDTVGLRGNQICEVRLTDVEVPAEHVLGRHLSPTRRGLMGAVQGFNRLRPGVAALALGIARGAYEYVVAHRRTLRSAEAARLERTALRIEGVRRLVYRAGEAVDRDDPALGPLASAAKARAAQLAEEVTLEALEYFGAGARLDHPLLDKFARDARGVEFMEGTRNIQRLNLFQGLSQGKIDRG